MTEESKQEDLWESAFSILKEELKKLDNDFESNFIKPNIVLSGKTGVGKSTLINAIFGNDVAKEGSGKPVSQSLIKYSNPEIPVNLFDTKGIELSPSEREISRKSITDEIKIRANTSKVEDHMHIMWYCISNGSDRIEDVELEWIKDFSKYMPVIIVLTKTLDNDEKFKSIIEDECPDITVCRVLAKEKEVLGGIFIPPHGLETLINLTIQILPEATKRAFTAAQKIIIEEKIQSAKKLLEERLDDKRPLNYKNLAHTAELFPLGIDVLGKGAVYLYMAKDIMTVMGIPVTKNSLKFFKEARPLLKSIVFPFLVSEGTRTTSKVILKYGAEKLSGNAISVLMQSLGKISTKGNIMFSPILGMIIGTFNRKVTEKISYALIEVCADFLRNKNNYEVLTNEEILSILSKNMEGKMGEIKESLEASKENHSETI